MQFLGKPKNLLALLFLYQNTFKDLLLKQSISQHNNDHRKQFLPWLQIIFKVNLCPKSNKYLCIVLSNEKVLKVFNGYNQNIKYWCNIQYPTFQSNGIPDWITITQLLCCYTQYNIKKAISVADLRIWLFKWTKNLLSRGRE